MEKFGRKPSKPFQETPLRKIFGKQEKLTKNTRNTRKHRTNAGTTLGTNNLKQISNNLMNSTSGTTIMKNKLQKNLWQIARKEIISGKLLDKQQEQPQEIIRKDLRKNLKPQEHEKTRRNTSME